MTRMIRLVVLASFAGLAACGRTEAPAEPPVAEPPAEGQAWALIPDDPGVVLVLEENGEQTASLACPGEGPALKVASERFNPVMSEDRFTVGVDGEPHALAADLDAPRARGVEAGGDLPAGFLERLEAGGEIAFNYGYQSHGPFPPAPEAAVRAFAAGCRERAAARP